ncbi:hypothetical protein JJV70_01940 [Streptomyces sp. JJ66]|uniref:hypothetical protein n=1 Tax=Streptomyces sp. JJ66 TaxID=2803843 RepID=UPI001C5A3020|nr:hypothetical protein [Streptomyces sp. JJ66]MBW1600881.1 hypothetical protein [Streptomyces sp. JJ66]
MAAGAYDIHIEQGATCQRTWTCISDDGSPYPWTGWQARAQIRTAAAENGDLILDLTPHLTLDGHVITLVIPAAVTETLTRHGRWDMELYDTTTGYVVRLLQGQATLSKEVTR